MNEIISNRQVVVLQRIQEFGVALEAFIASEYNAKFKNVQAPKIELEVAAKYVKVVRVEQGNSRSVHSFIVKENGDILKAAGWKAPAKHVRGNVFDDNFSIGAGVNAYGARYL